MLDVGTSLVLEAALPSQDSRQAVKWRLPEKDEMLRID